MSNRNQLVFYLLIVSLALPIYAQTQSSNGVLLENETYNLNEFPVYEEIRGNMGELPMYVNLRKECTSPADQGNLGSCVAHAIVNTIHIKKASLNGGQPLPTTQHHSYSYLFNKIKKGKKCNEGAFFSTAWQVLEEDGVSLESDFGNYQKSCNRLPSKAIIKRARVFKVSEPKALFHTDASKKEKEDKIRIALAYGEPVIIAMYVPLDLRTSSLVDQINPRPKQAMEAHALVVVGYDHVNDQFELMNSYGAAWGDQGYFKLPYDVVCSNVFYGFTIALENTSNWRFK